jgi:hypothetical protein
MAAREEDKAMAGLLRRSLAQDAGAGSVSGEDCPGPEILAAYFDRALDAEHTARYDLHFSRCTVCRGQLAAMARAAAAGDANGTARKTAGAGNWLAGRRWLVPAAAMLVALLVITGVVWRVRRPEAPANEIAMSQPAAVPTPNPVPSESSVRPAGSAAPEAGASRDEVARASRPQPLAIVPRSATQNSVARRVVPEQRIAPREHGAAHASRTLGATSSAGANSAVSPANSAARRGASSGVGGAVASPNSSARVEPLPQTASRLKSPAMGKGAIRSGSGAGASVEAANSADENANATSAAPAPVLATSADKKLDTRSVENYTGAALQAEEAKEPNAAKTKLPATGVPARAVDGVNLSTSETTETAALARLQEAQISSNLINLQIPTPNAKILWMIAGPGAIERSENGGASWKTEYLETQAMIMAGAAPSAKICWLVGASGTILRTTNGTHWKTVIPPEQADFVRVDATDALRATVTALGGKKFSTRDGGKSWSSVQ